MPFFYCDEVIIIGEIKSKPKNVLSVLELKCIKGIEDYSIIRDDRVKLNVLKVEPVNFNLKTKVEQNNILESYKTFLKQCNFDFQIYIQTQKVDMQSYINEIEKCIKYESEISDVALDYINLIKELAVSKSGILRNFYVIYEAKEGDSRDTIIQECLKLCGNIVVRCSKKEIIKLFKSCFKKQLSNVVALKS